MDVLELNITLPIAPSERITAVDVLLPTQVKLHVSDTTAATAPVGSAHLAPSDPTEHPVNRTR